MTIGILEKGAKGVIGAASLKQTKLNLVAPSTHKIELNNPLPIEELCTTALVHIFDENDIMTYECKFDNSASENFVQSPYVTYEGGSMKLNPGTSYEMKTVFEEEYLKVYESPTILKADFGSTKEIVYTNGEFYVVDSGGLEKNYKMDLALSRDKLTINESDPLNQEHLEGVDGLAQENNTIKTKNINVPVFIEPVSDIDLSKIDSFTSIDWSNYTNAEGVSLLLISIDSGRTWKSFYEDEWVSVDIGDKSNIKRQGMDSSVVNSLDIYDIDELNTEWETVRFGYYLELTGFNGEAMNNGITITVRMPGEVKIAGKNSYEVEHSPNEITYTFLEDGTYTINTFSP